MFTSSKVRIDKNLWERIKHYAAAAGYASPEEFVTHVLEKEIARYEDSDSDEEFKKKLKGLGYLS